MTVFTFIAIILVGASMLSCALIILSVIMSSRATARLATKYPLVHGEAAWTKGEQGATAVTDDKSKIDSSTVNQMIVPR